MWPTGLISVGLDLLTNAWTCLFCRGKFAAVKRCRNTGTGEAFAAKVIRKRRRGAGLTAECLHEAATLDLCRPCPHIVQLEQVFDTPGESILILQL